MFLFLNKKDGASNFLEIAVYMTYPSKILINFKKIEKIPSIKLLTKVC